ncbi:MAG: 3'-5' exonuclease [Oscillospiraceae bacterium]|nr:3'-5' exonuclease [Oscillospiraceae bacterium]
MKNLGKLMEKYDKFVIFDTETTGLDFMRDEIIEFSAVVLQMRNGYAWVEQEYDNLVTLSPGNTVPPMIQRLTGISTEDIAQRGVAKEQVCRDIAEMFAGNTLLLAYNAHFDLSFLYYFLLRSGDPMILKGKDKLDLLTVYKDRRDYPHKLCNAIEAYGLSGQVVNSHRAIDDVLATVAVMEAMAAEKDDLLRYINLFGYNRKYGIEGKAIGSVTYKAQPYQRGKPLYEL